jgi:hypothetical protein
VTTARPLLLIDVDGVLNPHVRPGSTLGSQYAVHRIAGQDVRLAVAHGEWLHRLARLYDLAWATPWEADANALIGPVIGAPPNMPVIAFTDLDARGWTWKLPAVELFVADRPLAWLDDDHGQDAHAWAAARMVPTLLVRPDGYVGWTPREYDELLTFGLP